MASGKLREDELLLVVTNFHRHAQKALQDGVFVDHDQVVQSSRGRRRVWKLVHHGDECWWWKGEGEVASILLRSI